MFIFFLYKKERKVIDFKKVHKIRSTYDPHAIMC